MSRLQLVKNFLFGTKRRGLTVKTVLLAAYARFCIWRFPGSALHRLLGERGKESAKEEVTEWAGRRNLCFVSDKVARVARRVPWESQCLVQAMVAQRLLRGYGLPSTLYLGVGRDRETKKMVAHAWVRCGIHFVCGGDGSGYAVVATFRMGSKGGRMD